MPSRRFVSAGLLLLLGIAIGAILEAPVARLLSLPAAGDESREAKEESKKDKKPITVDPGIAKALGIEIGTAAPGTLATEFTVMGSVGFDDTKVARIAVRVSGTVRQLNKSIGDKVAQGDVLAVLDSRDIADAKATYIAAKDKLSLAEKTLVRLRELLRAGGGAQKDFLAAQRDFNQAQIDLRNAAQGLLTLGLSRADLDKIDVEHGDLARYEIVSPFAGEVLEKQIFIGELLPANRDVFVVADLDVVWVNLRCRTSPAAVGRR